MVSRETAYEGVNWMKLAQDRIKYRTHSNKISSPITANTFLEQLSNYEHLK
jgi:hypothetical protein